MKQRSKSERAQFSCGEENFANIATSGAVNLLNKSCILVKIPTTCAQAFYAACYNNCLMAYLVPGLITTLRILPDLKIKLANRDVCFAGIMVAPGFSTNFKLPVKFIAQNYSSELEILFILIFLQ